MVRDEIWSVSLEKATAFFEAQRDLAKTEDGFVFRSCRISLQELPSKDSAKWHMPRIRLFIEGPDEDVANIYHRFFIQFLTAGG